MLFVVLPASLVSAQDPCDSSLLMDELEYWRRHPDITTSFDTANICDYQLDECLYNNHYVYCCCFFESISYFCIAEDFSIASDSFSRFLALYKFLCMYVCMYV